MTIDTASFTSSMLTSASYDTEAQRLSVTFNNGRTYTLAQDVPPEVWEDFKNAASPGQFWHTVLKGYS